MVVALILVSSPLLCGCHSVDDDRIPSMPVSINLSDAGMWNRYGVVGYGVFRYFISSEHEPSGFPYTTQTYTGFGGVMLIVGMDPFTVDTDRVLAYDLSCPYECRQNIRVKVDPTSFEAVCPVCGSHYDVTMRGGAAISGPAATGKHKYGLRRYQCNPTQYGGYLITN